MAAIVHHSTQEQSAARAFWTSQLGEHPTAAGLLAIALEVTGFFLNGHFLVWLGQKVMSVAGRIAETALLFAVLWISGTSVAPGLVELVMSAGTMHALVSVALVALALIPEIILANAIVNALGHIQTAAEQRTPVSWAWAVLFTLPTVMFFGLTAYTLNVLIQSGGNFVAASTGLVGLRCFAGWTYGLLELVYTGVRRRAGKGPQLVVTPSVCGPAMQSLDYAEIARQVIPLVAMTLQDVRPEKEGRREPVSEPDVTLPPVHRSSACDPPSARVAVCDVAQVSPNVTRPLTLPRPTKQPSQESSQNGRGEAQQKALRILKRTPDIGPTELSKRAGISLSSAKRMLARAS